MAVQQWQGNDPGRQQTCKFCWRRALSSAATVGIHRCRDRTAQVDVAATGYPATKVAVGENTLQDAGFRNHEDQARLIRGDLAEGGKDRVLSKYDELREVSLNLDTLHSQPRKCLRRTNGHYLTSL